MLVSRQLMCAQFVVCSCTCTCASLQDCRLRHLLPHMLLHTGSVALALAMNIPGVKNSERHSRSRQDGKFLGLSLCCAGVRLHNDVTRHVREWDGAQLGDAIDSVKYEALHCSVRSWLAEHCLVLGDSSAISCAPRRTHPKCCRAMCSRRPRTKKKHTVKTISQQPTKLKWVVKLLTL